MLSSALIILSDSFCTIAFQLLIYQKEFNTKFSKKLYDILSLIKSTIFRSATIKFKERQIRFNSVDTHNFFFSSDWIVDKIKIRTVIKQFFKNIVDYRLILSKKIEISAFFISAFTENRFLTSQLIHIKKDNSVFDDIFIIWLNINDICNQNSNIMSNQSRSFKNILFNFEIISEQMQIIFDTLTIAMNTKINRLNNELWQLLQFIFQQSSQFQQIFKNDVMRDFRFSKDLIFEKVEFFYSTVDDQRSIINLEKHVFYKNIFAFVNRLKNVSSVREKNKLRLIISQCLRDTVLIWHSTELFDVEKEIYRNMFLQNWCNVLIKRFKKRISAILNFIQFTKYTLQDARMQKNFRIFAQNLFKHVKIANLISVYNQLILTWNNIDWQFRQHIFQLTKNTTIQIFLKQFDNNCDIWFELANHQNRFFIDKSFYKSAANRTITRYFNQSNRFSQRNDFAYQINQNRRRSSNVEITIKAKNSKNSNKGTSDREFDRDIRNRFHDRNNRKRNRNRKKEDLNRNKERENLKIHDKEKAKVYIAQKKQKNINNESANENLHYFDFDHDEFYDFENIIDANLVTACDIVCRRCFSFFFSNNLLHKHIRAKNCLKNVSSLIETSIFNSNNSNHANRHIIRFKIDFNKNIETDYEFRKWQYVIAMINLHKDDKFDIDCLNTEIDVTLADEKYFRTKFKNVSIRIMTISIIVRELKVIKHTINKYACCFMYFAEKKDDRSIFVEVIKEIHLMKNLKTNLLIENDVLNSELIDISTFTNSVFIESCEVIISICIKIRSFFQIRAIHAINTVISSRSKLAISIHKITTFERNYMFESKEIKNISIYAYIMNVDTSSILVRNEEDKSIRISRNFCLSDLIELEYSNVLQINTEHANLTLKISKSIHKQSWFAKILKFCVSTYHINMIDTTNTEHIHSNDVIIHNSFDEAVKAFVNIVDQYVKLWIDQDFAKLSMKNWMRISLKADWNSKIKKKAKIYSLRIKNKTVVDEIFNKLHDQERLFWTSEATSFSFSYFVVWRKSFNKKKNRVIVDIRTLNAIFLSNAYSLSLQSDIIQTIHDCTFISIIDCTNFFYQWRVHSKNRHRLTMIIHRDQKTFNVVVMSYRNSFVYVQRQIDRILRFCRIFARVYIDDVVVFSKFLNDHILHLKNIFELMFRNNIFINSVKAFIEYSSVNLLKQHVNSLSLSTDEKKIKTIAQFIFSKTLTNFETYLEFIDWFRDYIEKYVKKTKSLQNRKINLLKDSSKSDNARKSFATKMKFSKSTIEKVKSFNNIQQHFLKSDFLIHFNFNKKLYIDLNISDKNIEAIVYHLKIEIQIDVKIYSSRKLIQSILFLSRLLNSIETKYWSTKLKLTDLVWVLRKVRHMMKSISKCAIIYIDHEIFLDIAKQISLTISFIDKLNLRFVKTFEYIQRFDLIIRHKSDKFHIISDALFRLSNTTYSEEKKISNDEKLDVLFIASMIEMSLDFKKRLLKEYSLDFDWIRIIKILDFSDKDDTSISFVKTKNELIYRKKKESTSFVSRRMCVSITIVNELLKMIHNDDHLSFDKIYERIVSF